MFPSLVRSGEKRWSLLKKREDNIAWKGLIIIQKAMLIFFGVAITLITFGAAATRFATRFFDVNIAFAGFEELLVIAAFWLYMIGSANGSYEKSQITADILSVMMKDSLRKSIIQLIKHLLTFILCLVFLSWAWDMFIWTASMGARTPVYRIPASIGQASVLVGLALTSFFNGVYLYDEVKLFIAKHIKKQPLALVDGQEGTAE